jgi:predicted transcriptional regulator
MTVDEKLIKVMEYLANNEVPKTVDEIAVDIGMEVSVVQEYLDILAKAKLIGYVEDDEE